MSILCLFGRHHRSRGKAHDEGLKFVSVCRHCGCPMKKLPNGTWVADG
mgnify:FL=1